MLNSAFSICNYYAAKCSRTCFCSSTAFAELARTLRVIFAAGALAAMFVMVEPSVIAQGALPAMSYESLPQAGIAAYTHYQESDIDSVNLGTGNVNVHIPLVSFPQLGNKLHLNFIVRYNEPQWTVSVTNFQYTSPDGPYYQGNWVLSSAYGSQPRPVGADVVRDQAITVLSSSEDFPCMYNQQYVYCDSNNYPGNGNNVGTTASAENGTYVRDRSGAEHQVAVALVGAPAGTQNGSPGNLSSAPMIAPDGSGWLPGNNGYYDREGNLYTGFGTTTSAITDTNHNIISTNANGWKDTLGRQIPGSWTGPGGGLVSDAGPVENDPLPGVQTSNFAGCLPSTTEAREWDVPSANGGTSIYRLCYSPYTSNTQFDLTSMDGYRASSIESTNIQAILLTRVVLPDETTYDFTYDNYLELTVIKLPNGGTVTYGYTTVPWDVCQTSMPLKRVVTSRTVLASASATPAVWTYAWGEGGVCSTGQAVRGASLAVTVSKPDGNSEVHTSGLGYDTVSYYSGAYSQSKTPIKSVVNNDFTFQSPFFGQLPTWPNGSGGMFMNYPNSYQEIFAGPTQQTITTLDNGMVSETDYTLVPNGGNVPWSDPGDNLSWDPTTTGTGECQCVNYPEIATVSEYDYGSGSHGNLLKTTTNTYQWQTALNASSYLAANLLDLTSSVEVQGTTKNDPSLTEVSLTDYDYDETNSPAGAIGNLTSTHRLINPTSGTNSFAVASTQYNSQGMPTLLTDANLIKTSIVYQSSTYCPSPYTSAGIFPQYVYLAYGTPIQEKQTYGYDCNSGAITSYTDANNQTSSYTYETGIFNRLLSATYPDTGSVGIQYVDGPGATVQLTTATGEAAGPMKQTVLIDGLGRTTETALTSDPYDPILVDTTYDLMGRVASKSNPHRAVASPSDGITSYTFDPLSRPLTQTQPDGSMLTWSYSGATTTSTDEVGNSWARTEDALGRLIEVVEPPNSAGVKPTTQYSYDGLGNLLGVDQLGTGSDTPRMRSFTYDGLSRLICSSNTEISNTNQAAGSCPYYPGSSYTPGAALNITGTVSYTYDPNGNLLTKTSPAPNCVNPGSGCTTMGTTSVLGYAYDSLDRLCAKFYSAPGTSEYPSGCPSTTPTGAVAAYTYDTSSITNASNDIGRLTNEVTLNGSTVVSQRTPYSYDKMGRLLYEQQCPLAPCSTPYTFGYTYDLAGNVTGATNGLTESYAEAPQYTYDGAGRLATITNGTTTLFQANSSNSSTSYGPVGLIQAKLGISGTDTAISMTRSYDDRLRLVSETDLGSTHTEAAAVSTGVIEIAGTEVSQYTDGEAQGDFYISGGEQEDYTGNYDQGTVGISIGNYGTSYNYGQNDSPQSIVSGLVTNINAQQASSKVTAYASGSSIYLTSNSTGAAGDYGLSGSVQSNDLQLNSPSFGVSWYGMNGGSAPGTIYDSGYVTVTINGTTTAQVPWGQNSTPATIAPALVSAINTADSGFLQAELGTNGTSIYLHSTQQTSSTNWTVTTSVVDSDSTQFNQPSFTATATNMSGGTTSGAQAQVLYSYNNTGQYAPNGNLLSYNDSVMGDWLFSYDHLNRLTSTTIMANAPTGYLVSGDNGNGNNSYGCWAYDDFGNRTIEAFSTTDTSPCTGGSDNIQSTTTTPLVNNQVSGLTYDVAGNVTLDSNNTYVYDPEGRLCAVLPAISGSSYTEYVYDAEGERVAKAGVTTPNCTEPTSSTGFSADELYLLDKNNEQVSELNGSGTPERTNFWSGENMATYDFVNGGLHFALTDWLGTKRVQVAGLGTNYGNPELNCVSMPFGNNSGNSRVTDCYAPNSSTAAPDATEHHFTGKERDTESGNDYFMARYYSSAMGRFIVPDWAAKAEPVPYAKMDNPQSLNLFTYVMNNPLSNVDSDGHSSSSCNDNPDVCQAITNAISLTGDSGAAIEAGKQALTSLSDTSEKAIEGSVLTATQASEFESSVKTNAQKQLINPNLLVGLAFKESSLNPATVNGDARGLFQITTDKQTDLKLTNAQVFSVSGAIPAVASYLSKYTQQFSDNEGKNVGLSLALASWTMGVHNTYKTYEKGGMKSIRSADLNDGQHHNVGDDYIDFIKSFQ